MGKLNRLLGNAVFSAVLLSVCSASAGDITGAGATFPYPIYAKWTEAYKAQTGTGMNYQAIGSGNGINQIRVKTVDFAATDAPLTPSELGLAGLTQFPSVIGGVVPVVNIAGIAPGQLKFSGKVLADVFLGKITKWNDPRIVADNAGISLPDAPITIVHRSDSSGTSFIFTTYLSQISAEWKKNIGAGKSVSWPVGTGGNGNEGVSSYVQRINNSVGYVEYTYASQNKLAFTQVQNNEGQFVKPEESSFKAAAANAHWDADSGFYEVLTNEPGKESWPITGASFILVYRSQQRIENGRDVLKYFDWVFSNGDGLATELHYVPLPATLKKQIRDAWKTQIRDSSGTAVWK